MRLMNMTCPSCGAPLSNRLGGRVVTCEYCGSKILLDGDNVNEFLEDIAQAEEDEANAGLPMAVFAQRLCAEFLESTDQDCFKDTQKVRRGLEIRDGDDVYLIHDDTMFHTGKNGFAITNRGLYCRGMYEPADFLDWNTFAKLDVPEEEDGYIVCRGRKVCYFTDSTSVRSDLVLLYQRLHRHAGRNDT